MENIYSIYVSPANLRLIETQARRAEIGGRSQIRGADRQARLAEDNLIGMIGQFAGHLWLFGNAADWRKSRWVANQYPTQGDGGSDVLGANVDFKTSLMRASRNPLDYRLAVRPAERHRDWIYVLILVDRLDLTQGVTAFLAGWATEDMLPTQVEARGPFQGAYTLPARALNPVMPLRWWV